MINVGQRVKIKSSAGTYAAFGVIEAVYEGEVTEYAVRTSEPDGRRGYACLTRRQFTLVRVSAR